MNDANKTAISEKTIVHNNDARTGQYKQIDQQMAQYITWRDFSKRLDRFSNEINTNINALDTRVRSLEAQINRWKGGLKVWGIVVPIAISVLINWLL